MAKDKFTFTEQEKQRIKEAVQAAERRTAGEIIPFFTEASDDYEAAPLRVSLIFMITGLFIGGLLSFSWTLPFPVTPLEIILFTLLMGGIGFLLTKYIAPFKRLMIPNDLMQERVEQKALIAFLEEKIFQTADRTGILIFVSHFEHTVEVIGDVGINTKVKQEEWEAVVKLIIKGIKTGDVAGGLVEGIHLCGELLERGGVDKPLENPNELRDDIRRG